MDEIQSIARFKIHDGKLEDWRHLVADAMETVLTKNSGEILGTPSAALRDALEGADVRIYVPYQAM